MRHVLKCRCSAIEECHQQSDNTDLTTVEAFFMAEDVSLAIRDVQFGDILQIWNIPPETYAGVTDCYTTFINLQETLQLAQNQLACKICIQT